MSMSTVISYSLTEGDAPRNVQIVLGDGRRYHYTLTSDAAERALKAGQDTRDLVRERYDEMLAAIVLYIDWHYVTRQLTTEQKELFAAAISRHRGGLPVYATRWWQSEAPALDDRGAP